MMNGIQAIETFYRGIRFRSRLEARWAKLFSELGIDWMYETEGYNIALKDGTHIRYLPDFVLRGGSIRCPDPLFVEVKGDMKAEDAIKIRAFSDYHPIYVVGAIPEDITDIENGIDTDYRVPYYNFETVDGDYFGAVLGAAKGSGWGLFGADSNYWREMDEAKTRQAYALARMARFE
jgi:hypothetical protein